MRLPNAKLREAQCHRYEALITPIDNEAVEPFPPRTGNLGARVSSDEEFCGGVRNVDVMQKREIARPDRGNVTPKVRDRYQESKVSCFTAEGRKGWGRESVRWASCDKKVRGRRSVALSADFWLFFWFSAVQLCNAY